MTKPVILTGLRANNDLHIGNYLGAIMPTVDMAIKHAGKYQVNLFVPDLHSFTTPIDHSKLQAAVLNNVKIYAAAGLPLNSDTVHIYRQSYIPAHSELTWILDCFTGMGEMSRMTQFKDKSQRLSSENSEIYNEEFGHGAMHDYKDMKQKQRNLMPKLEQRISVGLFNYPVLMAADILLYNATYVPVGEDQTQHLEFARDISTRFNNQFGDIFTVPKPVSEQHTFFGKDQGLRIKDLQDPSKKMSKSDESGKGVIFLTDTPETARKKIMSAVTDDKASINYDKAAQPGVSNLLDILALLRGKPVEEIAASYAGHSMYGPLKSDVADVVVEFIEAFQTKYASVDEKSLLTKLVSDEELMNKQAQATLLKVQKAVGLR